MRIGFALNEPSAWLGGASYYYNLFSALKLVHVPRERRLIGFFSKGDTLHQDLRNEFDETCETDEGGLAGKAWRRISLSFSSNERWAWLTPESSTSRAARRMVADVVFFKHDPLANFRVPSVCWFPDFQYLHLPQMFPPEVLADYKNMAVNMARNATRVMLSSQSVLNDFKALLPDYVHKVRVVPFAAWIGESIFREDPRPALLKYHLPEDFFYLPNQFWLHKNHRLVLDALELALKSNPRITIVSSGALNDFRNPLYPSEFVAEVSRRGMRDQFILLGMIPRGDVYALARLSLAVVQPSLFEGWNSSIEEAKSLGKRVIASDLDVHREQNAAGSVFFNPHRAEELASILIQVHQESAPGPDPVAEASAQEGMKERAFLFGKAFMDLLVEAVS